MPLLFYAIGNTDHSNPELVRFLLEQGADPHKKFTYTPSEGKMNAFDYANKFSTQEMVALLLKNQQARK